LGSAVLISREKTREGACAKGEAVVTVVIATKGFQLNMVPASKSLRLLDGFVSCLFKHK
jgi:hypothetical protein